MIFIVGNSRSGTTMLGRAFGLHSQVHTFKELQFFENVVGEYEMRPGATLPETRLVEIGARLLTSIRMGVFETNCSDTIREETRDLIKKQGITDAMTLYAHMLQAETQSAGKAIPCEQTPRYLFDTKAILASFPDARFIHIYRDPRAVLLSQKNRWRRGFLAKTRMPLVWIMRSWSNYHPYLTSRVWKSSMTKGRELCSDPRFVEVAYESLLQNSQVEMQRLCDHAGIAFEPTMLAVQQIGSSSHRDRESSQGFDASRTHAWREGGLTRSEIGICEQTAGATMENRGYTRSGINASFLGKGMLWATLIPKGILAVVLNFRRFRSLGTSILRRL